MLDTLIEHVINIIDIEDEILVGYNDELGGLSIQLGPGYNDTMYLDKETKKIIPIVFYAKYNNQQTCIQKLDFITNKLEKLTEYTQVEDYELIYIITSTETNYIGVEKSDRLYIYSTVVDVTIRI